MGTKVISQIDHNISCYSYDNTVIPNKNITSRCQSLASYVESLGVDPNQRIGVLFSPNNSDSCAVVFCVPLQKVDVITFI